MSALLSEQLRPFKNIVWDWNGTLLDDLHLNYQINADMMAERGLNPHSVDDHRQHFNFPVSDFLQFLGFDLEAECYKKLSAEHHIRYMDQVHQSCRLFDGTESLLGQLKSEQKNMAILSLAEQGHLSDAVSSHNIQAYFDFIYGALNTDCHSKIERAGQLLEESGFDPEETVMVGDTLHDAEVAKATGMTALLIGDGHQCPSRFTSAGAFVLNSRYT